MAKIIDNAIDVLDITLDMSISDLEKSLFKAAECSLSAENVTNNCELITKELLKISEYLSEDVR